MCRASSASQNRLVRFARRLAETSEARCMRSSRRLIELIVASAGCINAVKQATMIVDRGHRGGICYGAAFEVLLQVSRNWRPNPCANSALWTMIDSRERMNRD